MILADLPTPTGQEFMVWLSCGFACLCIAAAVKNLTSKPPATPQPLRVTGETRFATHEELTELRVQFEVFRSELRGDIKDLQKSQVENYNAIMKAGSEGRARMYQAINDVAAAVHRLEGKLEE